MRTLRHHVPLNTSEHSCQPLRPLRLITIHCQSIHFLLRSTQIYSAIHVKAFTDAFYAAAADSGFFSDAFGFVAWQMHFSKRTHLWRKGGSCAKSSSMLVNTRWTCFPHTLMVHAENLRNMAAVGLPQKKKVLLCLEPGSVQNQNPV
jgi:hypothetical protein